MRTALSVLVAGVKWPPETFIARLIRGLLQKGHHVTVACGRRPEAEWWHHPTFDWIFAPDWSAGGGERVTNMIRVAGAAVLRAPSDTRGMTAQALRQRGAVERVRTLYRTLPFAGRRWDVIYFPWTSGASTYRPLLDRGIPVVVSCRGSQIHVVPHVRTGAAEELRSVLEKATAVHCVSEAIRDEALAFGLDPRKATVIQPGVDTEFFSPAPQAPREHPFTLVATGSLVWVKGYEYLLAAVRHLLDAGHNVHLNLIGDGPERQRLLFTMLDLGLESHVTLLGRLKPEAVRDQLRQGDAVVLSSVSEGIANAVLEGMACGLPAVATACGGMPEVIRDGVHGFLVPARDPSAIKDAVAKLIEDPRRREEMGKAARQRVLESFTLDRQVSAFSDLLERVSAGDLAVGSRGGAGR